MSILLVTYDLKAPGRDYASLYETLKTAPNWWHYLDSTWLIQTNDTPKTWSDKLHKHMDANDALLVIDVTKRARQGWLNPKAWEWIYKYMD